MSVFYLPIKEDAVYHSPHTDVILQIMLPTIVKVVEHIFKDHLPGGKFQNFTEKSVDKHNKYPERMFAYLDFLLAIKPNISNLASESYIMFGLNKTLTWLQ